jgi:hypothetical protein
VVTVSIVMKEVLAMRSPSSPSPDPLLTVRTTVVLMIALVVGLVAGGLAFLAHCNVATAVLVGGGAAGGGLALFHALVGP